MSLTLGCIFTLGSIALGVIVGFGTYLINNIITDISSIMTWIKVQISVIIFCSVVFIVGIILICVHFVNVFIQLVV